MGGVGSGPSFRYDVPKRWVERYPHVDIRELRRQGQLQGVTPDPGGSLEISWTVGEQTVGEQKVRQSIALAWTACHYGGHRPWLVCPGCGRRVVVVYRAGPDFRCRRCYGLGYQSQGEGEQDHWFSKAHRIRERLGVVGSLTLHPPRPKGMHLMTYYRLWYELIEATNRALRLGLHRMGMEWPGPDPQE